MSHLGERITEFVFAELSVSEMDQARRHVAECAECRNQVRQFQETHAFLKSTPDVEPPRRIVFEVEKPAFSWRWLVPAGVAAAIVVAVLTVLPIQMQWQDSQLTVAFGKPLPVAPVNQATEYQRIAQDIRQLQAQLEYLDAQQRSVEKQNFEIASNLQKLTPRNGGEE